MKTKILVHIALGLISLTLISCITYYLSMCESRNKYVNKYFRDVFKNDEKVRTVCVDKYVPKGTTTLDNIILTHQLCECVVDNMHTVMREKQVYKAIKHHIVNVFNIVETREHLVDIAIIQCAKDFSENPDKERPKLEIKTH